ncbi:hypothetical protein SAMN04487995_6003 [Dyadobacter koreensis]|uniref:Uncharacterized protein n=1 Tax=Dyadobacter koreensis TaxID=408657 RepID=A0A1H7AYN2_9BACT|nr:hypothetical protein [Dyadobacter koreensis]SEJ69714.1 hypothetical protein SAMN04487995_6003 [Dyadobacter koreensis]
MSTANPWVAYVSFVTSLLSAYYLLVGFIFYRHDLKTRILRWRSPPVKTSDLYFRPIQVENQYSEEPNQLNSELKIPQAYQKEDIESEQTWENEGMMQQLEELSLHLKQAIEEAHNKQYNKDEFVLLTQMTFKEYPAIYGTPFQLSVNRLIEAELAKYGSIHLSSEDRLRMWNQVD